VSLTEKIRRLTTGFRPDGTFAADCEYNERKRDPPHQGTAHPSLAAGLTAEGRPFPLRTTGLPSLGKDLSSKF
jgi:hypothetical protein